MWLKRIAALAALSVGVATPVAVTTATPALAHNDSAYTSSGWVRGFDFSWSQPPASAVKAYGGHYVMVYISPTSDRGKHVSRAQIDAYRAGGVNVGLIYETTASRALGGTSAGRADALAVNRALDRLGLPRSTVVYSGAIDFDVQARHKGVVAAYLDAQANIRGKALVGVYGEYTAINWAASWGYTQLWQTYAWSGGNWSNNAILRQVHNGYKLSGRYDTDLNYSLRPDKIGFVGTTVVSDNPLPPTVTGGTVLPAASSSSLTYTVRSGDTLSRIASKFGTSVAELARCSAISNPNRIRVGQIVRWGCSTSVAWSAKGKPTVKIGDRGAKVREVQWALNGSRIHARLRIDGVAGPKTLAAIKRYQRAVGLKADGIVGFNTWTALHNRG